MSCSRWQLILYTSGRVSIEARGIFFDFTQRILHRLYQCQHFAWEVCRYALSSNRALKKVNRSRQCRLQEVSHSVLSVCQHRTAKKKKPAWNHVGMSLIILSTKPPPPLLWCIYSLLVIAGVLWHIWNPEGGSSSLITRVHPHFLKRYTASGTQPS